jgi:hypothetical protein
MKKEAKEIISKEHKSKTSAPEMSLRDWFEQEADQDSKQAAIDSKISELSEQLDSAHKAGDTESVSRIRAQKQEVYKERRK